MNEISTWPYGEQRHPLYNVVFIKCAKKDDLIQRVNMSQRCKAKRAKRVGGRETSTFSMR